MSIKVAERNNVLTETENKSFIHAVINAVTKGYSDNTVLEDVLDLVRRKEVSKGVIQAAPEALRAYGESIKNSLDFLAEQIEDLEIIDEPTINKKKKLEQNVVEEEMNLEKKETLEEEKSAPISTRVPVVPTPVASPAPTASKIAAFDKFCNLEVTEDWDKYFYDEKSNTMSGILKLNFNQNLSKFISNSKVVLDKNDIDDILTKIYSYFSAEFKNLKANLSTEIFKTDIKFSSLEQGKAEAEYEIKSAF